MLDARAGLRGDLCFAKAEVPVARKLVLLGRRRPTFPQIDLTLASTRASSAAACRRRCRRRLLDLRISRRIAGSTGDYSGMLKFTHGVISQQHRGDSWIPASLAWGWRRERNWGPTVS